MYIKKKIRFIWIGDTRDQWGRLLLTNKFIGNVAPCEYVYINGTTIPGDFSGHLT